MRDSIQTRVLERLERSPTSHALGFFDGKGECRWLSRSDLHRRASSVAARLQDLGSGSAQPLILQLGSDERLPAVVLGALLAGAVPLLLAPPLLSARGADRHRAVDRAAHRAGASLIVTSDVVTSGREAGADRGQGAATLIDVAELATTEGCAADTWKAPRFGSRAALQLTSGTTSEPRICVWRQRSVLAALDAMHAVLEPGPETRFFNWTPLFHDLGLVNNLLFCLVHGIPLVLAAPQRFVADPGLWLRGISSTRSTVSWAPNFGFALTTARARDVDLEEVRLDHVDALWNAAERVHLRTAAEFLERFSQLGLRRRALRTSYGCAENVGGATFSGPGGAFNVEHVDVDRLYGRRQAQSVARGETRSSEAIVGAGRPVAGVGVRIVSPVGEDLPDGHVGEIVLDTHSRMEGYLADEATTHRVFQWGGLRTGDLGYLRRGELFWVGRIRERITVRGWKLDPSALEPVLIGVASLRAGCFVAFGVDNPSSGTQDLVVVSEVRHPFEATVSEVEEATRRAVFDRYQISVADVVLVEEGTLVKTSSGKRRHRHYRDLYRAGGLESVRLEGRASVRESRRSRKDSP